jgi:hypothetical protein
VGGIVEAQLTKCLPAEDAEKRGGVVLVLQALSQLDDVIPAAGLSGRAMTSPPAQIMVECPAHGERYEDWFRASLNLNLEHFDENYIREASTATCPSCGHVEELGSLIVEGDVCRWR